MVAEDGPYWVNGAGDVPSKIVIWNAGGVEGALICCYVTELPDGRTQLQPDMNEIGRNSKNAIAALRRWSDEIMDASTNDFGGVAGRYK